MFDALLIAAVVDELQSQLVGGRIQEIAHVDALTLAFEVYALRRRRWLVVSADHERARAMLYNERVGVDPEKVTPLLLLLRKYARGGRIVSVAQPRFERIIRLSIAKPMMPHNDDRPEADDDDASSGEFVHSELVVEIMGRRSNIMLVDASGRVRDAIKRVSAEMSRVRPILPGVSYVPPPPQNKLEPQHASASELVAAAAASDERVGRWLVGRYQAVSPALAREVARRAGIDPHSPVREVQPALAARIVTSLDAIFLSLDSGDWSPMTYALPGGTAIASPIHLLSLEEIPDSSAVPHSSISEAIRSALSHVASAADAAAGRHAARRERLVADIGAARSDAAQRVRSLEEQQDLARNADAWRSMGEAIFAATGSIPPGASEFITYDGTTVALDSALSPSENAQRYFERYRKSRSAAENIPALLEAARAQLGYLDQMLAMARLAESFDDIESVRFEWMTWQRGKSIVRSESRTKGSRPPAASRRPRSLRTSRGDQIWVGRTGPQNEQVTFDIAGPADLWLHARNMPGAHVILRWQGTEDDEVLEGAASLAAWYSDGRGSTTTPVDVTERRNVRKLRGGGPGLVTYRNERTLNVRPRPETDLRLEGT